MADEQVPHEEEEVAEEEPVDEENVPVALLASAEDQIKKLKKKLKKIKAKAKLVVASFEEQLLVANEEIDDLATENQRLEALIEDYDEGAEAAEGSAKKAVKKAVKKVKRRTQAEIAGLKAKVEELEAQIADTSNEETHRCAVMFGTTSKRKGQRCPNDAVAQGADGFWRCGQWGHGNINVIHPDAITERLAAATGNGGVADE